MQMAISERNLQTLTNKTIKLEFFLFFFQNFRDPLMVQDNGVIYVT